MHMGQINTREKIAADAGRNKRDRIFNPVLLMEVKDAPQGQGKTATFNFVLKLT